MSAIYNLNNGQLEVYNMEILRDKVNLFRKNEMKKLPEDERVLDLIETRGWFTPRKDVIYENQAFVLRKNNDENNDSIIKKCVCYPNLYNGYINKLKRTDNNEDLIILELFYKYSNRRIQLTEDLCNDLLIEEEEYDSELINLDRVGNLRELFRISETPLQSINFEEIKKLYETNLIEETLEDKIKLLENSTKVYEKLKSH